MGMNVDKAGRHNPTCRIDDLGGVATHLAHRLNLVADDTDIAPKRLAAAPIHDQNATDHKGENACHHMLLRLLATWTTPARHIPKSTPRPTCLEPSISPG